VGGDYFDFATDEGRVLIALGDVSGKGTGAALLMTVLRAAVRAHWTEDTLGEAVSHINRTVCQNVPSNKFVTFFVARLDPGSGEITYVNAGHNPPLLIRAAGDIDLLHEGGMVLGLFENVTYEAGRVELRPGDTLLAYSDGVSETWSPDGEEYGEERLSAFAREHRGCDAAELQAAILGDLEGFEAGAAPTDDRTLVVLQRLGGAS
jgi:sigma-B regulation protein RsbU (phosphoserine phosphatase)